MSTTMDVSPISLETSPCLSSSRRPTIRPSATVSSNDSTVDGKPGYSGISFGVFSGNKTRAGYTSFRVGLEDLEYDHTQTAATATPPPAFSYEQPTSPSPRNANCLVTETHENSPESFCLNKRTTSPSPAPDFLQIITNHQAQESYMQLDDNANLDLISNSINLEDEAPKTRQLSKQQIFQDPPRPKNGSLNKTCSDPSLHQNLPDNYSPFNDEVIVLSNNETDDESTSNEGSKLTDCITDCSSLMKSSSPDPCTTRDRFNPSGANLEQPYLLNERLNGSCICDAQAFPGKIIFNRNGCAYVVEDASIDWVLTEAARGHTGFILPTEDQSRGKTLPQLSSVTFFPKRGSSLLTQSAVTRDSSLLTQTTATRDSSLLTQTSATSGSSLLTQTSATSGSSLLLQSAVTRGAFKAKPNSDFISFLVFEVGTQLTEDVVRIISSSETCSQSQHFILMCLGCRLVFSKRKSFLRHTTCCHHVVMNEGETAMLRGCNASAILQTNGNSLAKILILFPVNSIHTETLENTELAGMLTRKLTEYEANNTFLQTEENRSLCNYEQGSHNFQSRQSPKRSPSTISTRDFNSCLIKELNSTETSSQSSSSSPKKTIKRGENLNQGYDLSSPDLDCDEAPIKKIAQSTPVICRLKSSLQTTSSTSSSSSAAQTLFQSPSTSSESVLPVPPLVLPSTNSATRNAHSAGTPLIFHTNSIQMPNFLQSCDIHTQGRSQGMECSHCDIISNSPLPSGGHVSVNHSRNSCKTLKCPKCNWHYKYHETLEIHMKEKHPDNETECVYCIFSQIHPRLARGESYSCGYKPYRCEVCNYSTTTKGNLSIHMQSDKHINNIQDLATGSSEHKPQLQQTTLNQPATNSVFSETSSPFSQEDHQFERDDLSFLRERHKQSFRCGICNYETSVARNLRIHMTSDKHAHKVLVMTQSLSRLHQDYAFQQANQMSQPLATSEPEQSLQYSQTSHKRPALFLNDDNATAAPISSIYRKSLCEDSVMLTTQHSQQDSDHWESTQDAAKMFQCCICCKYDSDSAENVLNHTQNDRTKSGSVEPHISVNNGAYMCNLCSYKTHLKANFHLHCKTDKHLQRLQVVNHILEGGLENEWRLSQSISPVHVYCNACSFHANSAQKMQLHVASVQHASCAKLFRHLQWLEQVFPIPGPGSSHCYHCSICDVSVGTKQKLVAHSTTPQHVHRERLLQQSCGSVGDVFQLREIKDGQSMSNEEGDDENGTIDSENCESATPLASSKKHASITDQVKALSVDNGTITAVAASSSSGRDNSNAATNMLRSESNEESSHRHGSNAETAGQLRALAVAAKTSGSPPSTQITSMTTSSANDNQKSDRNGHEESRDNCSNSLANFHSNQLEPSPGERPRDSVLCPLCRHECSKDSSLSDHLVKVHNVVKEGIEKILSMVEMPSTASSSGRASGASLPLPTCNGSGNNTERRHSFSSNLSNTSTTAVAETTPGKELGLHKLDHSDSNTGSNNASENHIQRTSTDSSKSTKDTSTSNHSPLSVSSSPVTSSPSTSSMAWMTMNNHATSSSLPKQCPVPESVEDDLILSLKDKEREINLEQLEAEDALLLTTEAINLAPQMQLDKEFEEMFCCQTCSQSFSDIDRLFDHQNELGHLELKLTPRGPGYICWKKGCNQYFKTASTLQIHFREIHVKASPASSLTPQEIELYKFKCGQCCYSFRSIAAMQKHTLIHLIQSVSQCRICYKRFNSVRKMEKHFETDHANLGSADINLHMDSIRTNAKLLYDTPVSEQFLSNILRKNGNSNSRNGISNIENAGKTLANGLDVQDRREQFVDSFLTNENTPGNCKDRKLLEEQWNSPSVAEDYYRSSESGFKCHTCKMGFASQRYLFVHNKTSLHRENEKIERFDSHPTLFRCDVCKESFSQKSNLQAHYNSSSHLNKLKQQSKICDDNRIFIQTSPHLTSHAMSPYSLGSMSSYATGLDTDRVNGNSVNIKPYRCNICQVSYNNLPSFDIHLRSVGHKSKSNKLGELIQSGQLELNQAIMEHPDPRITGKQQAQVIADMIHQQASSQAAASFFNFQGALPHELAQAQLDAYYSSISPQFMDTRQLESFKLSNAREYFKEKPPQTSSSVGLADISSPAALKDDDKAESASIGNRSISDLKSPGEGKAGRKDDDLPPQFHAPIIARPRGFMGRFKPQLYKSLLENFGFECVMLFNEENTRSRKDVDAKEDTNDDEVVGETSTTEELDDKNKDEEHLKKCLEKHEDIGQKCEQHNESLKIDETSCSIDLTEVSKRQCITCHKDFSNVWVLKNHEEEVHDFSISPEVIEEFGQKFKEEWIKNLPRALEQEATSHSQTCPNPPTTAIENIATKDMPPPKPPIPPQLQPHFELSQMFPFLGMNLLPMHLSLNLVNLGLQNSMMPSMMLPSMDLSQGFLPHMPPPSSADSPTYMNAQQQFLAAASAANAHNQKRVRTRISDDQLKVLRQYFDINNSPSEEQVNKMANQTGLAQKVIKHWFRNTLFKERQRNKDSPYNFNNPPSTSIDLDEYDRTGKIPEIKLEPDDDYDGDSTPLIEVKKEHQPEVEEAVEEKREQCAESFESNYVKLNLTPKPESNDEGRKDQDSYSNSSSPIMSSIPSTPTASAPPTPTSVITANPINTANSLAFSLDSYAASISRMEAAAFQSLGKRANRTRFTDYQIKTLQDYFERNAYPKDDELEHLSKNLGLSARVIVVWFQNARQKARKIFENHPSSEGMKESSSPFQRKPGMNYQCKKCNTVYHRYYELIKHQKHCCADESNNNSSLTVFSMTEDDSNFSYSNDDSSFSDRQSTPAPGYKDKDFQPRPQAQELSCAPVTPTSKIPPASSTPSATSPHSSTAQSLPVLKCDKCAASFSRFDTWQEHVRAHCSIPPVFVPFSSNSVFGPLQSLSNQDDNRVASTTVAMATPSSGMPSLMPNHLPGSEPPSATRTTPTSSLSLSPSSKRKTDSEDDSGEQPKDKRLRTTILPEQLDYLHQQYQIDCNPSRKQLEHIALTVNLKKRVVQVWFQNTRARERKGHYRNHQQIINKRCPFCRALFRAKSALESHLATKHPEEVAKGEINVDLIPDAPIEPPPNHMHNSMSAFSGHDSLQSSSTHSGMDINKFMPQPTTAAMSNYMNLMSAAPSGFNLSFHGPTPEMLNHVPFEDNFFKKYLNDMVTNMTMRQDHPLPQSNIHLPSPASTSAHSTSKPPTHHSPSLSQMSRHFDAHKLRTTPQPPSLPSNDDAPLDLSKPVKFPESGLKDTPSRTTYSSSYMDFTEPPKEINYAQRPDSMDESFTESELADHEYTNDSGSTATSPSRNMSSFHQSNSAHCSIGKRYRTQMSAAQVKVMKNLFQDYKTPTMAECELLAQEIGLAKRVVQVWFQNARAKEKKAKLNSGNPFNPDTDYPKAPEECKLCSYKYTHKVTVQDHIFTKAHIDRVKAFLTSQGFQDTDLCSPGFQGPPQAQTAAEQTHKMWDNSGPNRHLAQIQAMEHNSSAMGYPNSQDERCLKTQEKELQRKEKKMDGATTKDEQQHSQAALEMAMNVQMLSALGGYMPSLEPAYLPYMYNSLPGYFPGMGLPMMQQGMMPEHMLAYDTLTYGTPLALLQIPNAAIKSISEKVKESGAVLARYTQDNQALADLHNVVEVADLTVAAEATLDVGYICKNCHMVYPARDSCIAHQNSTCMVNKQSSPKEFEPIMKLEQVQYECRACKERYSTILEFKSHCQHDSHRHSLMKFKAREAARHEETDSPSSSAAYASSSGRIISSSTSHSSSKPFSTSPSNNNNNSRTHNNNEVTSSDAEQNWKPTLVKSSSPLCTKPSPITTSLYSDKHLPVPSLNYLT